MSRLCYILNLSCICDINIHNITITYFPIAVKPYKESFIFGQKYMTERQHRQIVTLNTNSIPYIFTPIYLGYTGYE